MANSIAGVRLQVRGRHGAHLALDHVPAGEHVELRPGAGLGARLHQRLQLVSVHASHCTSNAHEAVNLVLGLFAAVECGSSSSLGHTRCYVLHVSRVVAAICSKKLANLRGHMAGDQHLTVEAILLACRVAMGFDDGAVMIKIGREEPVASMDSSGKIIWARHNEIQTVNVKSLGNDFDEARSLSHSLCSTMLS